MARLALRHRVVEDLSPIVEDRRGASRVLKSTQDRTAARRETASAVRNERDALRHALVNATAACHDALTAKGATFAAALRAAVGQTAVSAKGGA